MRLNFITFFILLLWVGGLFSQTALIHDKFTTPDATPLTSPRATEPSGDSLLFFENGDGFLDITGGMLRVTNKATTTDGQLGFRSQDSLLRVLGRTLFANFDFPIFPANTGQSSNPDVAFGFLTATSALSYSGMRASSIAFFNAGVSIVDPENFDIATVLQSDLISLTDGDSIKVAVFLGGYNSTNSQVYYSGQTESDYLYGTTVFTKTKNETNWLLLGKSQQKNGYVFPATNATTVISGTTDTTNVDFFHVTDSPVSLIEPLIYLSGTGTNGTGIESIVPEVGGAWTEVSGTWEVQSNNVRMTSDIGSPPVFRDIVIRDVGKVDTYAEFVLDFNNVNGGVSMVIRWNAADSSHLLVQASVILDDITVYSYDGGMNGTYTALQTTHLSSMALQTANSYTMRCRAIADTIETWIFLNPSGSQTTLAYMNVTNSLNNTSTVWGVRTYVNNVQFRDWKAYPVGTGGEYSDLNDYYNLTAAAVRRRGAARNIVW